MRKEDSDIEHLYKSFQKVQELNVLCDKHNIEKIEALTDSFRYEKIKIVSPSREYYTQKVKIFTNIDFLKRVDYSKSFSEVNELMENLKPCVIVDEKDDTTPENLSSTVIELIDSQNRRYLLTSDAGIESFDEGFKEEKLHCIYNSLDYDNQIVVRKSLKESDIFKNRFHNNYPVLCYVGRIQQSKRLDILIESIVVLRNKYEKLVNLVIVGKESDDTDLEGIVEDYKLSDNVWFYGPSYDENELGMIFYNSNLCVSPGNVGLTAIHSLTYGCPTITHNSFENQGPEFESITPGITGDFFEEKNIDDIAFKINTWLELHPTNDDTIRNECYKVIDEKYNPHYQIELLKKLLV